MLSLIAAQGCDDPAVQSAQCALDQQSALSDQRGGLARSIHGLSVWRLVAIVSLGQCCCTSLIRLCAFRASLRSLDCMLELIGTGSDPVLGRLLAALLFPLAMVLLQLLVVFCVRTVQQARALQPADRPINAEEGSRLLMPGASALDIAVLAAIVTFSSQQFAVCRVFLEAFLCVDANGASYLAQDTSMSVLASCLLWLSWFWCLLQMLCAAAVSTID
jgi:hypothetical protein